MCTQLARAQLQQKDPTAGLFAGRARGIQNQPLAERFGEGRHPCIKIIGHAEWQTAAGHDVVRLRRQQRQLIEAAFLVYLRNLGAGQDKAEWFPALALLDRQAFTGEPGDRDRMMCNPFLVQHVPNHLARRTTGREDRDRTAAPAHRPAAPH